MQNRDATFSLKINTINNSSNKKYILINITKKSLNFNCISKIFNNKTK